MLFHGRGRLELVIEKVVVVMLVIAARHARRHVADVVVAVVQVGQADRGLHVALGAAALDEQRAQLVAIVHGALEEVYETESAHDCAEAAQAADKVLEGQIEQLLEEQRARDHHAQSEEHIVDGGHDGRVEHVERLVQIVDLHDNADDEHGGEHVRVDVGGALLVSVDHLLDAERDALARHDRVRAEYGADEYVDEHVGVAVLGHHVHNEENDRSEREDHEAQKLYFVSK